MAAVNVAAKAGAGDRRRAALRAMRKESSSSSRNRAGSLRRKHRLRRCKGRMTKGVPASFTAMAENIRESIRN